MYTYNVRHNTSNTAAKLIVTCVVFSSTIYRHKLYILTATITAVASDFFFSMNPSLSHIVCNWNFKCNLREVDSNGWLIDVFKNGGNLLSKQIISIYNKQYTE